MVFYSLVSLLCHFGPICPKYTTAHSLLNYPRWNPWCQLCVSFQSAPIFCYVSHLYLPLSYYLLTVFLYILICLSLCSPPLTCSLFSWFCRLLSLLHTSSLLSWDSTRGALKLFSSSPFPPAASFSQELSLSSSTSLSVVWLSSVDGRTQFRCVMSQFCFESKNIMSSKTENLN